MNATTDPQPTAIPTSEDSVILFYLKAFVRWSYTVGLGLCSLSLVILTLAAYQFQARITEIEAKNAEAGTSTKVELASELRDLQAKYRAFRRYADDRWSIFLEADRRVSDDLRPRLYAQIREERRAECPWLGPLQELPLAVTNTAGPMASLTGQSAMASENPAPIFAQSSPEDANPEDAALMSALQAHREHLNYEKLVYELAPDKYIRPDLFTLYQDMMYFDDLRKISFGLIDPMAFALMPSWMLTLIVTLAMGALGSSLHVARSYLEETCQRSYNYNPLSWFLVRPLLGVVTAFAIFVFLQAGLALTDDKLTEGSLNPFFIAFIATLSGLMSWQAIESIQRWGERFLGKKEDDPEETPGRWAYGLEWAFQQKPEKTVPDLAAFLGVEKGLIDGWMAEQQRVPQDAQEKIAAWFGIDRRYLFSDQKLA
jgi:hypothetical protein